MKYNIFSLLIILTICNQNVYCYTKKAQNKHTIKLRKPLGQIKKFTRTRTRVQQQDSGEQQMPTGSEQEDKSQTASSDQTLVTTTPSTSDITTLTKPLTESNTVVRHLAAIYEGAPITESISTSSTLSQEDQNKKIKLKNLQIQLLNRILQAITPRIQGINPLLGITTVDSNVSQFILREIVMVSEQELNALKALSSLQMPYAISNQQELRQLYSQLHATRRALRRTY